MTSGPLIAVLLLAAGPVTTVAAGPADAPQILVTFADPGMTNASRAGPAGPGYRRRSSVYLVSLTVKRAAKRIARDFELVTLDEWPIPALKVHCLVFAIPKDAAVDELLTRLRARPEVESAQRMNEFEAYGTASAVTNDPYAKLQHNLTTLGIAEAHNWSVGAGTLVTIIDTGADLEHPELKTRISSHRDFVGDAHSAFSNDAHGTAMAGVIGAAANNGIGMIGVAPSAQMSVLRACWHSQSRTTARCNSFTLAKALSHAVDSNTDIINLSLSGPSDALLHRLVMQALKRGIIVVAAAPATDRSGFPAEVPGVIVVGSDRGSAMPGRRRPYRVNAPAEDILVPVPRGGYDYASGNSLAAAHVSGIAALLVAMRPGLTSGQVNTLLIASRPTDGDSVSACRALARLLEKSGCRDPVALSQKPAEMLSTNRESAE